MPPILLNVPRLAQRSHADCLPACVAMVLSHYGRPAELDWLYRVLESKSIGTPGFKVRNLERHGYAVTYAAATDERVLRQALEEGVPPIALLFTANLAYWSIETAHAVVVVGIDGDAFMVNDPAVPADTCRVPHNEFMLAWSDFDYLYALIRFRSAADVS